MLFSKPLWSVTILRAVFIVGFGVFASACQTTSPTQRTKTVVSNDHDVAAISASLVSTQMLAQPVVKQTSQSQPNIAVKKPVSKAPAQKAKPITDLWQRISEQLSFDIELNDRLESRINWYLSQPYYLSSVSKRAAPYLYHIVEEVERRRMPMELALLPFVESDFRPKAVSSQQAVGAWQLVNATAYHFGITTDHWYDGRQDILESTSAALDYLNYLHKRFNGNWLHALAAYNSGEGRVKKAIANNKRKAKSRHFWHLSLPKETEDYVPKLIALSYLLQTEHPKFKRPSLPNYALTSPLDIGQQFDFSVLASLTGIEKAALHRLNPGYLRHQSSPNGPHKVLLPLTEKQLLSSPFFQKYFSQTYVVKPNDTLYRLARRFNTSVETIKLLNNKKGNMIRVGEKLKVKQAQQFDSLLIDYQISPYVAQVQKPKQLTMELHHTVGEGESLWKISKQYKVSVRDLIVWNKLKENKVLKPGKVLVLHLPKGNETPQKPASNVLLSDLEQLVKPETRSNR
ncbi:LysM peptidoglycan-binding domain-containing protein [Pseudoalteromonas sp. MMG022]|uniref:LysM peptidoglycan-binding domain-containing protein n=1 Tax=Pseudoalteromonas sp. MMG022 TaxID=2909978 RepID=UPI001F31BA34|nr:LysM peptidoglycan-binding domain-containing protein [Pseudoalteromonas sp. MMG022]MCF6435528.1 LysM peptidoglycan-binding domain-containing protein [Pseudoalteromonas sp. MMG022]